ncbi:hypothetical protein A1Q1_05959 [Trichosporon asahii var. asahii CBS 2479]|uniref:Splicing factor YJU2 n=1 Tax=Trichosporon asahii var. asahii (strain ATCC 90039 / CBS 2479 / JCM 2466 / KCTC 7840 / NBRC 103889/ NCYC 2677 / UAMH 7654) TaxID=1186058 RepID=J5Q565_TRIAS|nr:hypothetical protein A1Q1_05959 [Trichosporon asahii var. asahii CBS 2479]EJT45513.1 hypothetical protein A1Q1_05959 [Trichosporon asahii var. asahii CBS 2479]
MSERKVLNKYFPPDFDPSKIKRRKRQGPKNSQITVTLKAPYTMRCTKCGEYIYHGRKFNARKETAEGEEYLGVKVFRFYIKCTLCSQEITFKTDPKNADFTPEHGATLGDDPEALLAKLHEERLSREEEERRKREAEEDDAEVAKYFTKMAPPPLPLGAGGKGKEKAWEESPDEKDGSEEVEDKPKEPTGPTIKRAVTAAGEPSVASILAAKGKAAEPVAPPATAQVKRKREGMQKLLGIKKKAKA